MEAIKPTYLGDIQMLIDMTQSSLMHLSRIDRLHDWIARNKELRWDLSHSGFPGMEGVVPLWQFDNFGVSLHGVVKSKWHGLKEAWFFSSKFYAISITLKIRACVSHCSRNAQLTKVLVVKNWSTTLTLLKCASTYIPFHNRSSNEDDEKTRLSNPRCQKKGRLSKTGQLTLIFSKRNNRKLVETRGPKRVLFVSGEKRLHGKRLVLRGSFFFNKEGNEA